MKILDELFKYKNKVKISGLSFDLNVQYILNMCKISDNIIVVTSSLYEANSYYKSLITYKDNVDGIYEYAKPSSEMV